MVRDWAPFVVCVSLNSDQQDPAHPDRASAAEMTSTASQLEDLRAMLVENKVLAAVLPEDESYLY